MVVFLRRTCWHCGVVWLLFLDCWVDEWHFINSINCKNNKKNKSTVFSTATLVIWWSSSVNSLRIVDVEVSIVFLSTWRHYPYWWSSWQNKSNTVHPHFLVATLCQAYNGLQSQFLFSQLLVSRWTINLQSQVVIWSRPQEMSYICWQCLIVVNENVTYVIMKKQQPGTSGFSC